MILWSNLCDNFLKLQLRSSLEIEENLICESPKYFFVEGDLAVRNFYADLKSTSYRMYRQSYNKFCQRKSPAKFITLAIWKAKSSIRRIIQWRQK